MHDKYDWARWILAISLCWLLYKSYLQLYFLLLPCPWMLMFGGSQQAAWVTSSSLFPSERLNQVVHCSFRSRLAWREVCGSFPSFWLLLFKLRAFPVNYLNWHEFIFFKGNKNTSAYMSVPRCSFQDICFWPLSEMMYWGKWTSSLTHSSFSTVLTEIPAAE